MSKEMLKTLSLAAAVTATGLVATSVQAEETTAPAAEEANTRTVTAEELTTQEGVVAEAKTDMDAAATTVATDQAAVDSATADVNTADGALAATEVTLVDAKETAKEATPEAIVEAEQAITTAETKVETATEAIAPAETAVTEANAAVSAQEAVVESAQTEVDAANANLATAEKAVSDLEKGATGVTPAQAQADVNAAEKAVETTETNVETKTAALETAKANDAKAQEDFAKATVDATTALTEAKATQATKSERVADAQATADQTGKAVDVAQAKADSIKTTTWAPKLNITPEIKDEYAKLVEMFNDQVTYGLEVQKVQMAKIEQLLNDARNAYSESHPNDDGFGSHYMFMDYGIQSNDDTLIDPDNLTLEQQALINKFAEDTINAMRSLMGQDKIIASTPLVENAEFKAVEYAKKYYRQKVATGHDREIMRKANAMLTESGRIGENLAYQLSHDLMNQEENKYTMKGILETIGDGINQMFFDDMGSLYGHARSLLTSDVFGLGVYENIREYYITDTDKISRKLISSVYTMYTSSVSTEGVEKYKAQAVNYVAPSKDQVLKDLAAAKIADTSAKANLATAKAELETAKANVTKAQATVDALSAPVATALKAQADYDKAVSELNTAKANLKVAQDTLAAVTGDAKAKAEALKAANETLTLAKAEQVKALDKLEAENNKLKTLQADVAEAEKRLADAKTALETAKAELEAAKADKNRLVNAQANLEAAQKAYDEAVAGKNVADQKLEDAKAKLEASKDAYDDAEAVYDKEKAIYDAMVLEKAKADEAARLAALQAKKDQLIADGKTPVAVYDNGVIVDYVAERPRPILNPNGQTSTDTGKVIQTAINQKITRDETQKVLTRRQPQETYEAKLPNTGEASSATYMLIGASLIALAVGTRKRRQG